MSKNTPIKNWAAASAKSFQLCPTLCDPIDGSPLGSSVPGIFQARVLECVAIAFSKNWAEDLTRHFPKEDIQVANRHMKRCSTWLVVGEMQTKTTMRFYLTPFRMTVIKKSTNNKLLERVWRKGNLWLVRMYIGTATMENSMEVP